MLFRNCRTKSILNRFDVFWCYCPFRIISCSMVSKQVYFAHINYESGICVAFQQDNGITDDPLPAHRPWCRWLLGIQHLQYGQLIVLLVVLNATSTKYNSLLNMKAAGDVQKVQKQIIGYYLSPSNTLVHTVNFLYLTLGILSQRAN